MSTRRALLRVHVWAGVILGVFWALQGLTGAGLVFNRDIQAVYFAHGTVGEALPLDALLRKTGETLGSPVTRLETFGPNRMLLLAYHETPAGERAAVVDARRGKVLEIRDMDAALPVGHGGWNWLLRLHEALLNGESGQIVVGMSGVALLSSIVIGLWNALPYRRWRDVLRMTKMRGSRQRLIGWHRLVGLAVAPGLLVLASCGIYLAFAPELRPWLAEMAGYRMPYKPEPQDASPVGNIDANEALRIAQIRFPGASLVRMVLPNAKSPVYLFRLLQPNDARRWAGTSTVAVDPRSGAIVDAFDSRTAPLANRLTDAIYSIHTGDVSGYLGRLLVLFVGLALPLFAVTGWVSWLRTRRRRRPAPATMDRVGLDR